MKDKLSYKRLHPSDSLIELSSYKASIHTVVRRADAPELKVMERDYAREDAFKTDTAGAGNMTSLSLKSFSVF